MTQIKLFCLAFFLLAANAFAAPESLNLRAIIALGLKSSPQVKKAEATLEAARADTKQKFGAFLPEIIAKSSAITRENPATPGTILSFNSTEDYEAHLEARQMLYTGGALTASIALQRTKEDIAKLGLVSARQTLVSDLVTLYYDIAENEQNLKAAEEHVDILQSYARIITRYQKIGRARSTDRLQAEVNLQTALSELASVNSVLNERLESLRVRLELQETPKSVDVSGITIQSTEKLDEKKALESAFSANPSLLIKAKAQDQIKAEKDVDLAIDMPKVFLAGQIGYRSPDQKRLFDKETEYNFVSLNVEVPLFSGLSSIYKRQSFSDRQVAASMDLHIERQITESGLRAGIKDLEYHFSRLQTARKAATQAREALIIANKDYERGLISSQDVVSIQRTRYESEKLFIRSQFEYLKALLKVRTLMGINLEKTYG
jgi:outer membrane protein TolC